MKVHKHNYKNHEVVWHIFGTGKRPLIALHGFGDKGTSFARLESLQTHFTIYALDLPFHGKTRWNAPAYSAAALLDLILDLSATYNIQNYTMLGHSYGARLIFTLLPDLYPSVEQLYLLAPDGIQTRSGKAARLSPLWLRRTLTQVLEPPDRFFCFLKYIGAKYWMPRNSYQFIHLHLSRPHRRQRTFGTWLSMADFPMEAHLVKKLLQQYPVSTDIFLGKKDVIIPPHSGYLLKHLPCVQLHILDIGHEMIDEKLDQYLSSTLAVSL
ncbi:MAG: alpha/beta hydrolase [Bacteroidota bacterium]